MKTDRLIIRKFQSGDIENLHQLLSDEDVMRYMEPPYSMEDTVAFLEKAGLSTLPLIYAVDDKNGKFAGYVIYHPYAENAWEIGWVLCKENWNKGYAQELTEALIQDAGERTEYLIIECAPAQTATGKLALKNGFVYTGNDGQCDVYKLTL